MLWLIRHAECEANAAAVAKSYSESGLTENGKKQLFYLSLAFQDIEFQEVYSSPLSRALLTSSVLPTKYHYVEDVLSEIRLSGEWENKSWLDIVQNYEYDYKEFLRLDPRYKSRYYEDLQSRLNKLEAFFKETQLLKKAADYNIAIVSHGATIKLMTQYLLNKDSSKIGWLDNACYSLIEFKDGRPVNYIENINSHIPEDLRGFVKNNWTKLYK